MRWLLPCRQPERRTQHRLGAIPAEGVPDGKGGTAKRRTGCPRSACSAARAHLDGVLQGYQWPRRPAGGSAAGMPVLVTRRGPDYEQSAVPAVRVILGVNKSPRSSLPTPPSQPRLQRILLQTVAKVKTLALACGGRFALIGDMSAAPDGTRQADLLTLEWAHQGGLEEVSNAQRHAMWKACLHPRRAILNRAWLSPPDLLVSPLSVHWNILA